MAQPQSKYYLDSRAYAIRRWREVQWDMLQRAYYEGFPYGLDPIDPSNDVGRLLWYPLMKPSETEPEEFPIPIADIHRELINAIVDDILPEDSKLQVGLAAEKESGALFDLILNFNYNYPSGEKGWLDWAHTALVDAAVTGDALLLNRFLPEKGLVRQHFIPKEHWDREFDPSTEEILFYRIEYRWVDAAAKEWWRRYDIWRDHIVNYKDKETGAYYINSVRIPAEHNVYVPGMGMGANAYLAGPMDVDNETPVDEASQIAMQLFGEFICTPLIWQRTSHAHDRGSAEMTLPRLTQLDQYNRTFQGMTEAAIEHGQPMLYALDVQLPEEEGSPNESDQPHKRRSRTGLLDIKSTENSPGAGIKYAAGGPAELLHGGPLDTLRESIFGSTPALGLDPTKISRFGQMSAFARDTLWGPYNQKIGGMRRRLLDCGLLRSLQVAAAMLKQRGLLPTGIDADAIEFKVEYSQAKQSPAESVETMTAIGQALKAGVPAEELVDHLPFTVKNRDATIAAMKAEAAKQDLLAEMLASKPTGGFGASPKPQAPTSNGQPKPADKRG